MTKDPQQDIIGRFKNHKVMVIGDAILDAYVRGTIDRICREAPAPVINVEEQENTCGGAANTALNLAALGAETCFLSVLGDDEHGKQLLQLLHAHGVNTACTIRDKGRRTIAKTRVSASSNILLRIDQGNTDPVSETVIAALVEKMDHLFPEMDAIVISDYGYGVVTEALIKALKDLRNKHDIPLVIDAKEPQKFHALLPTIVKPNYEEAIRMLNISKAPTEERVDQILKRGKKLLEITGARYVAATLDRDGAILFEKGKKPYRTSCTPQDNKQSIGAGDTFISALTLAFCAGSPAKTATEIASAAASIVLQKVGTEMCLDIELRSYFSGNIKFISCLEDLGIKVKGFKKEHKRIVFTNGCFDVLHRGHVSFLNQAKAQGDLLVVGLNDDGSIRRVKGKGRPINALEDRVEVLAGLQSVDYLIAFETDSPVEILKVLHPDVFVKGGTYTMDSLPEANLVRQLGGEVRILPITINFSTTKLIEKIKKSSKERIG